jgi:hypothetical protein
VTPYRIVVRGVVDAARMPLIEDARITRAGVVTTIELPVIDQSHLDGVLVMLRDRGTALISVQPLARPEEG